MLGRDLSYPHGVEDGGRMHGLCFLDADTVFESAKTPVRQQGGVALCGGVFDGIRSPMALPPSRSPRPILSYT